MLALGTLIVSILWRLPELGHYIGEHSHEIFITLVLAMTLTYLLRPPVNALNRTKFFGSGSRQGRVWATLFIFIVCGLLFYLFVKLSSAPISQAFFALKSWFLAQDKEQIGKLFENWQNTLQTAVAPYEGSLLPSGTVDNLKEAIPSQIQKAGPYLTQQLKDTLSHLPFIVELLLLPVLVFYFLCDGPAIRREAGLLVPAAYRPRAAHILSHLDRVLDGYIRGQVWMCIIAWIAVTLMLLILRVPHAFTLGLVAGITRAIPVIGPLLGGIPLVLVCLVTTRSMPITLTLLTGFILMHFVESKVLLPKIIGHEVDLHPVSVIFVLLVGLEFFGFLGVFLAVPVAAILKILLAEWHETQAARDALTLAPTIAQSDVASTQKT